MNDKHKAAMVVALKSMPMVARAYFPGAMVIALGEMSEELDRLRAEVDYLRSKIETKE